MCEGESQMRLAMYVSSTLPDGPVLDPPRMEPGRAAVLLAVWREHHSTHTHCISLQAVLYIHVYIYKETF